jgi:hypothetical protein
VHLYLLLHLQFLALLSLQLAQPVLEVLYYLEDHKHRLFQLALLAQLALSRQQLPSLRLVPLRLYHLLRHLILLAQ